MLSKITVVGISHSLQAAQLVSFSRKAEGTSAYVLGHAVAYGTFKYKL